MTSAQRVIALGAPSLSLRARRLGPCVVAAAVLLLGLASPARAADPTLTARLDRASVVRCSSMLRPPTMRRAFPVTTSTSTETLTPPTSKVHVGLGYAARLTWLRPEARGRDGQTIQSKRQKFTRLVFSVAVLRSA